MAKEIALDEYRDFILSAVTHNQHTVLNDDRWDANQKAGTAITMAVAEVSFAACLVAKNDPRLMNAPLEKQIDDFLDMMREVLVTGSPLTRTGKLSIVKP